mmetsp:Transcript_11580/g.31190  ORF Transcript_11580/g.31190 Transcript_11580/m.31190 type:complete len:257 (-) Transcript_11580:256-1026(-)
MPLTHVVPLWPTPPPSAPRPNNKFGIKMVVPIFTGLGVLIGRILEQVLLYVCDDGEGGNVTLCRLSRLSYPVCVVLGTVVGLLLLVFKTEEMRLKMDVGSAKSTTVHGRIEERFVGLAVLINYCTIYLKLTFKRRPSMHVPISTRCPTALRHALPRQRSRFPLPPPPPPPPPAAKPPPCLSPCTANRLSPNRQRQPPTANCKLTTALAMRRPAPRDEDMVVRLNPDAAQVAPVRAAVDGGGEDGDEGMEIEGAAAE